MPTPRGIRNRNPGNIEASGWTRRQPGYTGQEPEGRFAVFASMAEGVAALMRLLKVYREQHGLTTVRGIINRWAPPKENQTSAYATAVARDLGVNENDSLPDTPEVYTKLARAIARHENGAKAADEGISEEDYRLASAMLFGNGPPIPVPEPAPATPTWPFEESKMGLPLAVLAPILAKLVDIIPWFSSGSKSAERNIKVAQEIAPILVEGINAVLPAAPNLQAGVESILANPDLQKRFVAAVAPKAEEMIVVWEHTAENVAAARSAELDFLAAGHSFFKSPSFWVAMFLLPLVYMVVVSMMFVGPWLPNWPFEARTNIAGLIVGMIIGGLMGYYFGMMTSRNRVAQAAR